MVAMVTTVTAVVSLTLWLITSQVRGAYIPSDMNETIQHLLGYYKISKKDIFNGKPVFSKDAVAGEMGAKRVFMGGVLETYEELLGQMLKQLPPPTPRAAESNERPAAADPGDDARAELTYILDKVQKLRKHRYREQEKFLLRLSALKHIQKDDLLVQSKALWELPWLYEEASSLGERRRRRRQTKRSRRPSGR
ncbi:interferon gamma-like [Pungitius pungitius]|uniref:interferon gamma-like n=1 Tax=Pungitius pungitius TaxID=134920 RepID=UPI001888095F|nr:interferon gamma-like [Pungitius pungitius]